MKKWISLLCVCMMILGTITASVVSASAADAEKGTTEFSVKKGDEVSYVFSLENASEPVVGTDFSFYYDSSVFKLDSVADYNDNTDPEEWIAVINPDLDGEVRGVWSILKGVDFSSKRHFITVNLKAAEDAEDTHITYRIRFLYGNKAFDTDDPKPILETFKFTYDLLVNGEKVEENKAPEWNDVEPTENGKFIPTPDGDSEHTDSSIAGVVDLAAKKKSEGSQQNIGNAANGDNGSANGGNASNGGSNGSANGGGSGNAGSNGSAGANGSGSGSGSEKSDSKTTSAAPPATTAEGYYVLATDADGNVTATSDQAPAMSTTGNNKKGGSPVLWIIIALVVLAGGGAAVYFYMKKKPAANTAAPDAQAAPDSADTAEGVTAEETAPAEAAPEAEAPAQPEETQAAAEDETTQSADDASETDNQ